MGTEGWAEAWGEYSSSRVYLPCLAPERDGCVPQLSGSFLGASFLAQNGGTAPRVFMLGLTFMGRRSIRSVQVASCCAFVPVMITAAACLDFNPIGG